MLTSQTAIVLGATGLVGSALTRRLARASHVDTVVSITRRIADIEGVTNYVVDFEQLAQQSSLFQGELLFLCLGTTIKQAGSIQAQRYVDLELQHQAAILAREQGVRHCLLVSSSGANSDSASAYLAMKGELEARLLELEFQQLSIVQPSLLLGQRDQVRVIETLAATVLPALCKLPGLRRYRPINASEVADKLIQLSHREAPGVETYTLDEVFP